MQNHSVKHLPFSNKSDNFSSSGDRFISVASFPDDRILLNRSIWPLFLADAAGDQDVAVSGPLISL